MKYEQMCSDILNIVKKENIQDVFHCVTRLRFVLKDKNKVNIAQLEKVDGVIQVKEVGNQVQCVIGPHVADVYEELCEAAGFQKNNVLDIDEGDKVVSNKKISINKLLEILTAIFTPIIPALCAGGMIKSLSLFITTFGLLAADDGVLTVINAIGDAPFYFLPFMVAYTTAKRFKLNELLGLMVAGVLMYPTFLSQAGESVHFIFFDIPYYSYASTALPALLCVVLIAYLYRLINKIIPKTLSLVFTGMITFVVFMPIMLFIVAPIGNYCGTALSRASVTLFSVAGPIAGALFTGFMPFLIITGMHSTFAPIMIQNFSKLGKDFLFPGFFINNIAVAGATLGASFKIKDKKMKAAAVSNGGLGILGVTEPALFGICIKYKQALVGSIVGGGVGGALYMIFHVYCYAYAMPGIFSIVAYADGTSNIIWMIISLVAAFIVSFGWGYIFVKDEN